MEITIDEVLVPFIHFYTFLIIRNASRLKKIVIANPNADEVVKILGQQTGLDMSKYQIDIVKYFDEFVLKYIEPALIKS